MLAFKIYIYINVFDWITCNKIIKVTLYFIIPHITKNMINVI